MWRSLLGLGLTVSSIGVACSSSDNNASSGNAQTGAGGGLIFGTGGSNGGNSGNSTAGTSGTAGTNGSSGTTGVAGSCPVTVNDAGCTGELYVGETIPLDIYIMFDQSGSMLNVEQGGMTRIDAVRSAVDQ